jgi:hypothetical protein
MADAKMQQSWIRAGAEARLGQILEEVEAIYRAFPELRSARKPSASAPAGGRRVFSRKGKQAISEGMRKYWARRKAREAQSSKATSKSKA